MSDIATPAGFTMVFGTIVGLISPLFVAMYLDLHDNNMSKKTKQIMFSIAFCAFLWMPWVLYGGYCLWRVSMNGINYMEKPPVVIGKDSEIINLNDKPEQ